MKIKFPTFSKMSMSFFLASATPHLNKKGSAAPT